MQSEVKTNSEIIENLQWRYATKKFDPEKKLDQTDLDTILDSLQLTASSYGLQPYEVFVVSDMETRKKLKKAAWDQPQLTEASHVLIFANLKSLDKNYVNTYLDNIAKTRDLTREDLKGLEEMLENTTLQMSPSEQSEWAARQAYIALGNLLTTAATLKIDACPMEGFEASKFDEILGISEKNLTTAVIATIGYRSEKDKLQYQAKVRKSKKDLYHFILKDNYETQFN